MYMGWCEMWMWNMCLEMWWCEKAVGGRLRCYVMSDVEYGGQR